MNMTRMARHGGTLGILLVGLLCSEAFPADPYVILNNNKRLVGTRIRVNANGDIVLTTARGPMTFPRKSVRMAVAGKPAEFDRAAHLVKSGAHGDAVPILEKIVRKYRGLEWDNRGRELLAQAYFAKGDYRAAAKTCEVLFREAPARPAGKELRATYWIALLRSKQISKLTPILNEAVAGGGRADAAAAQLIRGDIRIARNDVQNAVLDYMRTVLLFEDVKAVQPEALFKAAGCLEKLRDNRAKDLYRKLVDGYPDSDYAGEARKRLAGL